MTSTSASTPGFFGDELNYGSVIKTNPLVPKLFLVTLGLVFHLPSQQQKA